MGKVKVMKLFSHAALPSLFRTAPVSNLVLLSKKALNDTPWCWWKMLLEQERHVSTNDLQFSIFKTLNTPEKGALVLKLILLCVDLPLIGVVNGVQKSSQLQLHR